MAERNELLEQHKKKWDERMEHRRGKEVEYMKAREKRVEDYEQQLHNIRVQDAEEYNKIKIRMETDVQVKFCLCHLHLTDWLIGITLTVRSSVW